MIRVEQLLVAATLGGMLLSVWLYPPRFGGSSARKVGAVGAEVPATRPAEAAPAAPAAGPARARWEGDQMARDQGLDLFTPPNLRLDPATGRWAVGPVPVEAGDPTAAFGFALVEVVREPFPLQLVGYAAEAGGWIGVFENRITARVFLARAPHDLPELNLRVLSLAVERQRADVSAGGTVAGRVAVAQVLELGSGETVLLTSKRRLAKGALRARLREIEHGHTHDATAGAEFCVAGVTYRVAAISDDPARVQLSRLPAEGAPETRWLHLAARAGGTP